MTDNELNTIVEGKSLREWLKTDNGLVDYDKCEFGADVSNNSEWRIFDLGKFYHDPSVMKTRYHNGVDLARVAGVATSYRDEEYDNLSYKSALDGDDYVTIFFNQIENATIADFVFRFFHIIDGDIYISETCERVFVKGRRGSEEELMRFVESFNSRIR